MGVSARWYDDQHTIILQIFEAAWTIEEHHLNVSQIYQMVTSTTATVHIISDFTQAQLYPPMMDIVRRIERLQTPNTGYNVMVKLPGSLQMLLRAIRIMLPQYMPKIKLVDSLEAAVQFLRTLP